MDKVLVALNKQYPFMDFKREGLKDYTQFKRILSHFQTYFGLDEFSLKEFDCYLWLLGKAHFSSEK